MTGKPFDPELIEAVADRVLARIAERQEKDLIQSSAAHKSAMLYFSEAAIRAAKPQ